jgi:spermidine/putrescine transport system ATP-binding protein
MQVELKRIQQEVGITFIYVTHDQEEAMTMSDRIAVMNRGRYEQLGDPESLYERPTSRFVAGFLGVSNLLPAKIAGTADGYVLAQLGDDARVRVPSGLIDGHEAIEVGVRPEKIRMHKTDEDIPSGANELQGTVIDASYLGVSTSYVVQSRAGARLTVYEQNVERTSHGSLHRPGETVRLSWSPDHTFVVNDDSTPAEATPD